jgi:uncharacterized protein (TIGR00730 family)
LRKYFIGRDDYGYQIFTLKDEEEIVMITHKGRVSVFGGSKPKQGEIAYGEALRLGRLLAETGFTVLTGGYIGTMEAASCGAAQAGGHVIGVTCDEIERWRPVKPNQWVMEEIRFETLKQRLDALITKCDAAVALPGGIGTMQEIIVMWSQIQVHVIPSKPLILVGKAWRKSFQAVFSNLGEYIDSADRETIHFSPNIDASIELLSQLLAEMK